MHDLFIVAAGLSTRFNGKPKHLAYIKGTRNIAHTLQFASQHYSSIYVVLNEHTDEWTASTTEDIASAYGAKLLKIASGRGDAHAVHQALVASSLSSKNASICWGDAWFIEEKIFEIASRRLDSMGGNVVFDAMCAYETSPYGWFEVTGNRIDACTFKSDFGVEDKAIDAGWHDQCFFNIDVGNFERLYEKYLQSIELKKKALSQSFGASFKLFKMSFDYEISWFKMINWANSMYNSPLDKTCSIMTDIGKPMAIAFNTEEELEKIQNA